MLVMQPPEDGAQLLELQALAPVGCFATEFLQYSMLHYNIIYYNMRMLCVHIYIYICICIHMCIYTYIYIYI